MSDEESTEAAEIGKAANLRPDAALKHGSWPLIARGVLSPEFALFQPSLEERRREALTWVGGDEATVFDREEVESWARWQTAADLIWSVLMAEGIMAKSRRGKALMSQFERCDVRAADRRKELRSRHVIKNVGAGPAQWLEPTNDLKGSTT